MKKLFFLVFHLPLFAIAGSSYFISPNGNDSNNGTNPANAWRTIEKINQVFFSPGDQILFEGNGTWFG